MADIVGEISKLRDTMLQEAKDEHGREIIERAFSYVMNRVRDGSARTLQEAKHSMTAFADGFCTGFHRGSGTPCTRR
jgi:hypothetical protein